MSTPNPSAPSAENSSEATQSLAPRNDVEDSAPTGPRLYSELSRWYRLLTPIEEYVGEAAAYVAALTSVTARRNPTLLELGAGAGHNAFHMKRHFGSSVLTDLSPEMLALSREINAESEHVVGDMRSLRLDREFDCVFVHDALCYMLTEDDLERAIKTAFVHTRPFGVALFAPDFFRETFVVGTEMGGADAENGSRGLRYLSWSADPDPDDTTYTVDFAMMLREGGRVSVEHDRHVEGLFPRATWERLLTEVGFEVSTTTRPAGEAWEGHEEAFLAKRPK